MTELREGPVEAASVATRRALAMTSVSTATAIGMGLVFRYYYHVSPMLPRPVLGVGAVGLILAATAVRYLRHRLATRGAPNATSTERLMYVLYWIGTMWATLAIF